MAGDEEDSPSIRGRVALFRKMVANRVIARIREKGEPAGLIEKSTSKADSNRAVLCISHNKVFFAKMPIMLAIVFCILMFSPFVLAIPELFTVQGRLTDSTGSAVTGSYTFEFILYDGNASDKNILWSETRTLSVSNGLFNVVLGDANTQKYISKLDFNDNLWLGIFVDGEEQTPLIRFSSIGSSFVSKKTMGIDLNAFMGFSDFNLWYHSIPDLNKFYYKKADVNNQFVPYIGADLDLNLGAYQLYTRGIYSTIGDVNFKSGSNVFTWDASTGRVGIGITNPGST